MQAQDKPDIDTFYDVYLDHKDRSLFCKRYRSEAWAEKIANAIGSRYKKWGYTTHIDVIEIPKNGPPS